VVTRFRPGIHPTLAIKARDYPGYHSNDTGKPQQPWRKRQSARHTSDQEGYYQENLWKVEVWASTQHQCYRNQNRTAESSDIPRWFSDPADRRKCKQQHSNDACLDEKTEVKVIRIITPRSHKP
jgi:hypothetical protein